MASIKKPRKISNDPIKLGKVKDLNKIKNDIAAKAVELDKLEKKAVKSDSEEDKQVLKEAKEAQRELRKQARAVGKEVLRFDLEETRKDLPTEDTSKAVELLTEGKIRVR